MREDRDVSAAYEASFADGHASTLRCPEFGGGGDAGSFLGGQPALRRDAVDLFDGEAERESWSHGPGCPPGDKRRVGSNRGSHLTRGEFAPASAQKFAQPFVAGKRRFVHAASVQTFHCAVKSLRTHSNERFHSGFIATGRPCAQWLGTRLSHARTEAGLSLRDLQAKSTVDNTLISRIERDLAKRPSIQTISQLAAALGVRREWLETGEGPMRELRNPSDSTRVARWAGRRGARLPLHRGGSSDAPPCFRCGDPRGRNVGVTCRSVQEPLAVVCPHRVYARGPEEWIWPDEGTIRQWARSSRNRSGIAVSRLSDPRRSVIRADG